DRLAPESLLSPIEMPQPTFDAGDRRPPAGVHRHASTAIAAQAPTIPALGRCRTPAGAPRLGQTHGKAGWNAAAAAYRATEKHELPPTLPRKRQNPTPSLRASEDFRTSPRVPQRRDQ